MNNDQLINDIIAFIKNSLQNIESSFFKIKTTYEPAGIVRERVFCYELYHQLKLLIPNGFPLSLNGEIDKRGHTYFSKKDRKNPDFVFHVPGVFKGNTILVEVKGKLDKSSVKGIKKDFNTLIRFVSKYEYKVGVFILYNHSVDDFEQVLGIDLKKIAKSKYSEKILILTIKASGNQCSQNWLSEFNIE